jgi:lipoprotein-releasing system permease protein
MKDEEAGIESSSPSSALRPPPSALLLPELALRHLLGGRIGHFIRHRRGRWFTGLLALVVTVVGGLRLAMTGSPVWGAIAFIVLALVTALLRRAFHGPLPDSARGAYATAVTFVAVLGIAIAVMTLIVVVSVMDGFSKNIQEALLKTTAEVTVTNFDGRLDPATAGLVRRIEGVRHADPYVESDLLVKFEGLERPMPVKLRGETVEAHSRPGGPELVAGSWQALAEEDRVVIGVEMARLYMLGLGDRIWLVSPAGAITPMGVMAGMRQVEVAGIFRSGFYEVDQSMVIIGLDSARDLLAMGDEVTGISVSGEDPFRAPELAERIRREAGMPWIVMSWAETRRNLYEAMRTEKVAMFIIESLLILIASFNISSTLYTAVARKTREIGLLMAMGLSRGAVLLLFSLEGFLIGATGTGAGALLGVGFALYLDHFPIAMPGGGSVYYIDSVPVDLSFALVGAAIIFSLVVSVLAAAVPAWRASRLLPARALRYE